MFSGNKNYMQNSGMKKMCNMIDIEIYLTAAFMEADMLLLP